MEDKLTKDDFIPIDGITTPKEQSLLKFILKTIWVWIFETPECPRSKRQRLKTLDRIRGIKTLEDSIGCVTVEEQQEKADLEEDEDDFDTEALDFLGD